MRIYPDFCYYGNSDQDPVFLDARIHIRGLVGSETRSKGSARLLITMVVILDGNLEHVEHALR